MSSRFSEELEARLNRVDELTSLLLDEAISESQVAELERVLQDHPDARRRYIEEMQLHCDLMDYFSEVRGDSPDKSNRPAILTMLGQDPSGSGLNQGVAPPPADPS